MVAFEFWSTNIPFIGGVRGSFNVPSIGHCGGQDGGYRGILGPWNDWCPGDPNSGLAGSFRN